MIRGSGRRALRKASAIRRRLFPSREAAAWKHAWHRAELTPRFTPGSIRMLDYKLRYSASSPTSMKRANDKGAPIPAQDLTDVGVRLECMDEMGIDHQVIFPSIWQGGVDNCSLTLTGSRRSNERPENT